ncbi:MAG: ATP-binding protein, partial [Bacillota bacterium]|nr:ATP-binding protein [Bacillota bacterium]
LLLIEVTDCGNGFKNIIIPEQINENDILKESGRGIYLINCYADEVKFKENSIIMKKYIDKEVLV